MCSADAELLACCEGGGNESAAGVRTSGGEVVVGFVGVSEWPLVNAASMGPQRIRDATTVAVFAPP